MWQHLVRNVILVLLDRKWQTNRHMLSPKIQIRRLVGNDLPEDFPLGKFVSLIDCRLTKEYDAAVVLDWLHAKGHSGISTESLMAAKREFDLLDKMTEVL